MKIYFFTFIFFFFYPSYGQSVYEKNKAEFKHCQSCEPKDEDQSINSEYVNIDLNRLKEMVNPIVNLKPNVSNYLLIYPALLNEKGNTNTRIIELKDELKFITHEFYGGYTSFELKILVYNDLIIYSRLEIEVEEKVFENIYLEEIQIPLTCSGANMEYYKLFSQNLVEYQKKYPNFTLEINNDKYSTDVLNAYYNLNNVESNFNTYHVDDDFVDLANTFFKKLLENKEYDIIKKLLFGVNPVSRIYAYSKLKIAEKDGYKIDQETKKQMEKVNKDGLQFRSGILNCWMNKFEYTNYDFSKETQ